jgi:hypothetical protein
MLLVNKSQPQRNLSPHRIHLAFNRPTSTVFLLEEAIEKCGS